MRREFIFAADGKNLCLRGGVFAETDKAPLDLDGFTIRPGIVDLHGDGFERHVATRRGMLKTLDEGLIALDSELAANGITTAILPQFFSWQGGMRGPWFAEKLASCLAKMQSQSRLRTDMRLQLRLEVSMIDRFDEAEKLIDRAGIDYVVFNDSLPYAALQSNAIPPSLIRQALRFGMEPNAYFAQLKALAARADEFPKHLAALAARLRRKNIRLGFHDTAQLAAFHFQQQIGCTIAEFPQALTIAHAAFDAGSSVILGAPNILRGCSHHGGMRAIDALKDGYCAALASDYHYPSLHLAARKLAPDFGAEAAWRFISRAPAECLGLFDRGRLASNMRADLTVLDREGRIAATLCAGRWSFLTHEFADLLMG